MSNKSSIAVSRHAEKLCHIYHQKLAGGSFAAVLGSRKIKMTRLTTTGSSFQFTLDERLTLQNKCLSVSAALALFDDLSTIGFMGADSCSRPGVSVHLQTELLKLVPAGTNLTLNCFIDKIGKTMGFTSMELVLTDSPLTLVARGTHIKFLPLGSWLMDSVVLQPAVLGPLINYGLYDDGSNIFTRLGLAAPFVKKITYDPTASAYETLGLTPIAGSSGAMQTKVHQALCNPMSSMHGGAVAMAAEYTSATCAKPSGTESGEVGVEMQLTYLSALTKDIVVEATADPQTATTRGLLRRAQQSQPAVTFAIRFGQLTPL